MISKKINLKNSIIIYFIIGFFYLGHSQTSKLPNGVLGLWEQADTTGEHKYNWDAQWIWMPENIKSDVMLARKSFDLKKIPKASKLRITASSKYELYVNGTYVCQGPARSAPHHQSFDILDISSLLKSEKNTIAVRVHYQKGTTSYHLKGRAGLLVQLDLENEHNTATIISDHKWKVHPDVSWDTNSPVINRFQLVVNDHIDFSKKILAFENLNFDDSKWPQAKPLLRNSGWPAPKKDEKATTLTTPWTQLVPRDIPYLKETEIEVINLIEAKQVQISDLKEVVILLTGDLQKNILKTFKKYLNKKAPLTLPFIEKEKTWFLVFDFGKVINGMPKLVIEGEKGTLVHVLSAPFIIDKNFTHKIIDSNFHDQLILSGTKDSWQAMYFKPVRYMAIAVKGNTEAIKIHFAGIQKLAFPFELKGGISTPEAPWIEVLWNASAKTIDVCTTDAYTDNYRERRQYAQTGYYAALGNYFTFGDAALQRRYLLQVAQEQEANGIMPAYAPLAKDDYMVILDSNCLWIRSLYNYLLYSGDYKTVKELLPASEKLMSLLNSFTNELGMLDNPPYSYWLDHTLNDRRGANLNLNGHYLGALEDYSKVLKWLHLKEKSVVFKTHADLLRTSLRKHLWDEEKQLFADAFIDGKRSTQFSEHGNAMALACKIASPEQGRLIAQQLLQKDTNDYIKRENGMTMVSPAMSYFLHKGLAEYGYEEASLQLLNERFGKMLAANTNGTLWEEWWRNGTGRTGEFQEKTRSDAQTESTFPPALFGKYIIGLTVTKPGMKEILISKPVTSLTNIQGEVPSPFGIISIQWNLKAKNKLSLYIPNGMLAKIDIHSLRAKNKDKITVNGAKIESSDFIELNSGTYTLRF